MIISKKKMSRIIEERIMQEYEHNRINKMQDEVRELKYLLETAESQIKILYGRIDVRTEPSIQPWDVLKPPYIVTCNTKTEGGK